MVAADLHIAPRRGMVNSMPELMALIQRHQDRYGVTRAEIARRAGTTPQTVQNWRNPMAALPRADHLKGVAEVIEVPYLVVLDAALVDCGYRESMVDDLASLRSRIERVAERDPAALRRLGAFIAALEREHAAALEDSQPRSSATADRIAEIIRRELDADDGDDGGNQAG